MFVPLLNSCLSYFLSKRVEAGVLNPFTFFVLIGAFLYGYLDSLSLDIKGLHGKFYSLLKVSVYYVNLFFVLQELLRTSENTIGFFGLWALLVLTYLQVVVFLLFAGILIVFEVFRFSGQLLIHALRKTFVYGYTRVVATTDASDDV
jgi:hypothetical protein